MRVMISETRRLNLEPLIQTMNSEVSPSAFSVALLCHQILSRGAAPIYKGSRRFDFLFHDFQARHGVAKDALEAVATLNSYLYQELQFQCVQESMCGLDHYFLAKVLEERKGSGLSFSMIYRELARRLSPAAIDYVNFPGMALVKVLYNHQLLFIDPAEKGRLLSVADLQTRLYRRYGKTVVLSGSFLETPSESHVLNRYLMKLKTLYYDLRNWDQLLGVLDILVCLNPTKMHEIKERGLLLYQMGSYPEACSDLAHFVTQARPSPETERLKQLVTVLENPNVTPLY